jgi:hypothetical protein
VGMMFVSRDPGLRMEATCQVEVLSDAMRDLTEVVAISLGCCTPLSLFAAAARAAHSGSRRRMPSYKAKPASLLY